LSDQLHQTIESLRIIKDGLSLDYGAFTFAHTDHNVSKEFFIVLYKNSLLEVFFRSGGIVNDFFSWNMQRFSLEKPLKGYCMYIIYISI